MDEDLERIARLLDTGAPPRPGARERAREELLAAARQAHEEAAGPVPGPRGRTARPLRRWARVPAYRPAARRAGAVAVALAVAVSAGVAAVVLGRGADGSGDVGARGGGGGRAAAERLVLTAAHRAEAEPAGGGRYWRVRTLLVLPPVEVGPAGGRYAVAERCVEDEVADTRQPAARWTGRRCLGAAPVTAADRAAWRRAGSPAAWDLGPTDSPDRHHRVLRLDRPDPGTLTRLDGQEAAFPLAEGLTLTWDQVRALPADPGRMRAYLLGSRTATDLAASPDQWLFTAVTGLLAGTPAPAPVRIAAFRLLAALPGIRCQGTALDALGRNGTVLTLRTPDGFTDLSLLIDPGSGRLLQERDSGPKGLRTRTLIDAGPTTDTPTAPPPDTAPTPAP